MENQDYYNILRVREDATKEEIKIAYILLKKKHKNDKSKLTHIEKAFKTLYDNKLRKYYDNDNLIDSNKQINYHHHSIPKMQLFNLPNPISLMNSFEQIFKDYDTETNSPNNHNNSYYYSKTYTSVNNNGKKYSETHVNNNGNEYVTKKHPDGSIERYKNNKKYKLVQE